jgi:hypothetical protein
MRSLIVAVSLVSAAASASAADSESTTPQQGYTTATLREPIFDAAQVAVDTTVFNNWLAENYGKLSANQLDRPREHLYYLIDSHIKQQFETTGQILPKEHDLILEILFSWAERLGVYGGNLVFNKVKSPKSQAMGPLMTLPKGMALELKGDLLHVQSDLGWDVSIPYYFMIGRLHDFEATNGIRTQIMIVSTGAAKDKGKEGHSQATLMLLFSPGADMTVFRAFWEQQFEIKTGDEHVELGVSGLTSQRNLDAALLLHRELVFLKGDRGALAVAYLGNDGTYQWNREHFLDFLRAVHMESGPSRSNVLEQRERNKVVSFNSQHSVARSGRQAS